MNYELWRADVFGQPEESDPVDVELSVETYDCDAAESLDHIDRALVDAEIHALFTREQIANGLNLIYSNACSDLPFCYLEGNEEDRRCTAIANLVHLYDNFFARYCRAQVTTIGYDQEDGRMGFICFMLWDIFVLYPGNSSTQITDTTLELMNKVIYSKNESCVASAIHGLGHWVDPANDAAGILETWLQQPTTSNPDIIDYARQATTGCIL